MLTEKVFIYLPVSLGGGEYEFELYFQDPSRAQFLNIDDVVEDTANNQYKIISPTTIPHTDGALVTVEFITNDVLPVEDTDYDSIAFTPGQIDYTPTVRTSGSISSPSLYDGPTFEWTITTGWNDPAEADKADVDDRIVDASGKEYDITYLHPTNKFDDPIRVVEVEKVGIAPQVGDATLYRATENYKFFQGTEITDPARTVIQNRDIKRIDLNLGGGGGGTSFNIIKYKATTSNQSASDPGSGKIKWNNATLASATEIYIDDLNDDSIDISALISNISINSILYIQKANDASSYQRWKITSITDNSGWWTFGVDLLDSNNPEFSNNNDLAIAVSSVSSGTGGGSGALIQGEYTNESGGTIAALTLVKQDTAGDIDIVDPSDEAQVVNIIGVTVNPIADGNSGIVALAGLIENITTSFDVGDVLYLSKIGDLTSTAPEIGVGGFVEEDFVVRVGKITKNKDNPSNKDLKLEIEIVGQL